MGPVRNVRDNDLHRALAEEEVLGKRAIDVQILAIARHTTEQELAGKVACPRDARGVPRHCNLITFIPSRGCLWTRDLWTDDDTLYKGNSVNEDENVKEEKNHETTSERDLLDSKREERVEASYIELDWTALGKGSRK